MKSSFAYDKIDTFAVCKDEWETNEGTGKSMKNALYMYSGMTKGT